MKNELCDLYTTALAVMTRAEILMAKQTVDNDYDRNRVDRLENELNEVCDRYKIVA